ncbi:MAG: entericidin A/B family lipoprotein [Gemmobacter sp.]
MTRHRLTPLIALLAVLGLSACETFKGFGRDVQSGGKAVTQGAAEVQAEL